MSGNLGFTNIDLDLKGKSCIKKSIASSRLCIHKSRVLKTILAKQFMAQNFNHKEGHQENA